MMAGWSACDARFAALHESPSGTGQTELGGAAKLSALEGSTDYCGGVDAAPFDGCS